LQPGHKVDISADPAPGADAKDLSRPDQRAERFHQSSRWGWTRTARSTPSAPGRSGPH